MFLTVFSYVRWNGCHLSFAFTTLLNNAAIAFMIFLLLWLYSLFIWHTLWYKNLSDCPYVIYSFSATWGYTFFIYQKYLYEHVIYSVLLSEVKWKAFEFCRYYISDMLIWELFRKTHVVHILFIENIWVFRYYTLQ